MAAVEPGQAGTVPVRVQVIDLDPRIVDIVVPTYLVADDLTQRIARDVGIGGWWEDGSRRGFVLRARGRVLRGHERLADLGVVPYELLHLLPEPRPGSGVLERPLGYTDEGQAPSRATRVWRVGAMVTWVVWWSIAARTTPEPAVAWFGAFGLGMWSMTVVKAFTWRRTQAWPAPFSVALMLVGIAVPLGLGIASAPEGWYRQVFVAMTLLGGAVGWLVGWLVWMGPAAPMPVGVLVASEAAQAKATVLCGICGLPVSDDVREACVHACGRVFHRGCVRARQSVATPGGGCAVCGAPVGAR